MADDTDHEDRTEEPTQRRLEQAIERGDVARSQEIGTWFVLAGGTMAMMMVADASAGGFVQTMRGMLGKVGQIPADAASIKAYGERALIAGLLVLAAPLGIIMVSGLFGSMIQHRPMVTGDQIMPKLSRVSPMAGLKRLFGKEALVNFLKGLVKIALVGIAIYTAVWPEISRLESFIQTDVANLLPATRSEALKLMMAVLIIYAVLAGADYFYQRFTWHARQRMTKEELKQEYKETEGNPEIKGKIKQLRQQVAKRRMMSKVPKATVVVTNPTHFAVALQYEPGMAAPICVAKGVDAVALRIRGIAEENGVPIVENPPLARALYKTVELDQDIPVEHYKAVAEVIGYVMRFRRRRA